MEPRIQIKYREEVIPKIMEKFGLVNNMSVPRMKKIVINMGVGQAITDIKILDSAVQDLTTISGQKPIIIKAKIAVSNFKLRKGMPIACKVTLRRAKMFEFFDRLVNSSLSRIRDFNGVSSKAFDKQGNYTLGISDQSIFPEIDTGKMSHTQGMDISFVFDNGPKEQTFEILSLLGMPFSKGRP